jgi:hypothetical protein
MPLARQKPATAQKSIAMMGRNVFGAKQDFMTFE